MAEQINAPLSPSSASAALPKYAPDRLTLTQIERLTQHYRRAR